MARNVPMDDFEGQVTRRDAGDWGADVERSSIAADSDWATNHERLRTETIFVPSVRQRRNNGPYPMTMQGKFVEHPADVRRDVKHFMGRQKYRTAQKPPEEE